jgi:nucleoid-associated protein YgaU
VKGETLEKIADTTYGNKNEWPYIYNANKPKMANPSVIWVGQKIQLPYPLAKK